MPLVAINPATGETVREFTELTQVEINAKLDFARAAFRVHRQSSFAERTAMLQGVADRFDSKQEELARLMALEMGKPLKQGRAEAEKCAAGCRWFAEHAEALLANEQIDDHTHVRHDPLGVVLALMPWNFPFWQVVRFAAPALMAGNVGLLKHADNTHQCGLALDDLFRLGGFPAGCLQYLAVSVPGVQALIDDPRIDAVTLTGSVAAGRTVAAAAGGRIKRTVLELGGSDPFIVLPSANFDAALKAAVQSRTQNNGQSCIAAKRFIVHEAVYDRFAFAMVEAFRALRVGDPLEEETEIGPIAQEKGLKTLERQVHAATQAGAKILIGGRRIDRPGFFFEPTILAGLPANASIAREEFFGPVALLFRVRDLEEALTIANDTPFGLAATIFSNDESEQQTAVEKLEAGQVFVNTMVASSPELPFGGVKDSGYGRELGGAGLREFVNAKSVRFGKS